MSVQFFKRLLPKSISSRFLIILIAPVVISQLVFEYVFFGRHTETVMNCVSEMVAGDIKVLADSLENQDSRSGELSKIMDLDFEIIQHPSPLNKYKLQHNRIYRSLNRALISKGINKFFIKSQNRKMLVFIYSGKSNALYKFSFLKKKIYSRTTPIVTLWGVSSAIILIFIALIFLKNQIRPIKRLAREMESFGKGFKIGDPVRPGGATEIRIAWGAFFNMQSNLKNLLNERMNTLAGISHDLKTPLTRMRLQLSLMPKNEETRSLLEDVVMMTKITESFISHASVLNNEPLVHKNLAVFLEKIAKQHEFPIKISGDKAQEVIIKPISFKRVLENIISNAEKYSENLYINFRRTGDNIIINLEDDGAGIEPGILEKIFTPFFSKNEARTKQSSSPNVGLGLSISRDIMLDHGGEIRADNSSKYGGAKFTLTLPNSPRGL